MPNQVHWGCTMGQLETWFSGWKFQKNVEKESSNSVYKSILGRKFTCWCASGI